MLDAYAVLPLLRGEAAAADVEALLGGDQPAALTSLGLAEVIDRLVRLSGVTVEEAVLDLCQLGPAKPSPLNSDSVLAVLDSPTKLYLVFAFGGECDGSFTCQWNPLARQRHSQHTVRLHMCLPGIL